MHGCELHLDALKLGWLAKLGTSRGRSARSVSPLGGGGRSDSVPVDSYRTVHTFVNCAPARKRQTTRDSVDKGPVRREIGVAAGEGPPPCGDLQDTGPLPSRRPPTVKQGHEGRHLPSEDYHPTPFPPAATPRPPPARPHPRSPTNRRDNSMESGSIACCSLYVAKPPQPGERNRARRAKRPRDKRVAHPCGARTIQRPGSFGRWRRPTKVLPNAARRWRTGKRAWRR